jgi:RNA polymerase sigma-70 factor (ECF subfamily)
LADLCDAYYNPVEAFLRFELRDAETARELAHDFFAGILGGGSIGGADQGRGRFRSYLLGAVKHFLSHRREAAGRLKRRSEAEAFSLDDAEAREADTLEDNTGLRPDAAFDRQWAVTVLARAMEALFQQYQEAGMEPFFVAAKPLLSGDAVHGGQGELAAQCDMTLASFRMAVHRLRKRLRECVVAEVAGTLADPDIVQEEMQALFAALGG